MAIGGAANGEACAYAEGKKGGAKGSPHPTLVKSE